ncbi:MAG TPA: 16S rRNA (cytosine(1402)-N(4))-methyltransferase RsmH [Actinomycetes bacterium]|nr:16S rRNA (cytosine(1402)-N(4))-methyltransferase RsmH [Actinomycetes bacterium]
MSSADAFQHVPVMRDRVVALLAPALQRPGSVMVDATLGLAGHSEAILTACPTARLVGIDRDRQALAAAQQRLADFSTRITLVHAVYDEIGTVLSELGLPRVNGVLFDLGVSSMQLDDPTRGFAYSYDAPLDMRMDATAERTAADVVNSYSVSELARVLREYGEERYAQRIARAIVARRPLASSAELVEVIRSSVPAPAQREGGHPAKRTFQALRIEVNDELGALRRALPAAVDALALHGRLVVMSYQSLEDRVAKQTLAAHMRDDVPPDLPVPGRGPELVMLTRGAERASDEEVAANPRSAPVRVRSVERVREAA